MDLAERDLDGLDVSDMRLFVDGPPHELFRRLRSEAPVHWSAAGDTGFWSVTRAADIETVSKDPATFSSEVGGPFLEVAFPLELMQQMMLGMDPPRHTRLRAIVQKAFAPHTVRTREDAVRTAVASLIDVVCESGESDFVADIAVDLPLQVIAELLGVPQEDRGKLFDWTRRAERAQAEGSDDLMDTFGEMAMYLVGLIDARREAPREDLISHLVAAEVDGERLSDLELVGFFAQLTFAGNDTTRNTASGGMLALLEHPEQAAQLAAHPERIPGAVEEMLRWVTAIMQFRRTATTDVELGGQLIKEGDAVVLWYASGSRDEAIASDAGTFNALRSAVEHQAFGGGGRHFCLGAGLARLELRVLFEEVLRRMPDARLAGPIERSPSNWINGITTLPVRFTPTPASTSARP